MFRALKKHLMKEIMEEMHNSECYKALNERFIKLVGDDVVIKCLEH